MAENGKPPNSKRRKLNQNQEEKLELFLEEGDLILKWNKKLNEAFQKGSIIANVETNGTIKHLIAPQSGTLTSIFLKESYGTNKFLNPSSNSAVGVIKLCEHDVQYANMCAQCGGNISETKLSHSIIYSHPLVSISKKTAEAIEVITQKRLLASKKLSLVLDLDHTLIHCTNEVKTKLVPTEDLKQFKLKDNHLYTVKFRPFLKNFLSEANKLFEIYIYTMGTRDYATNIVNLLKELCSFEIPDNQILSRQDCPDMTMKNLKRIFPIQDTMVIIVDDREDVWQVEPGVISNNLLKIEPYHYFIIQQEVNEPLKDKSLSETPEKDFAKQCCPPIFPLPTPEEPGPFPSKPETDNYLEIFWELLVQCHSEFYNGISNQDTKSIIRRLRRQVLEGCVLVFSRLFSTNIPAHTTHIWKMAEAFGAVCSTEIQEEVTTHVIAENAETEKAKKARNTPYIYLVNADWFCQSIKKWKREKEENFPVQGFPVLFDSMKPPFLEPVNLNDNNNLVSIVEDQKKEREDRNTIDGNTIEKITEEEDDEFDIEELEKELLRAVAKKKE